ncbi:hypothetical protein [Spirosoma sordidisoli]|uniref:REase AHJR-like domain-containing protein n=1 Tax=Spirosoma sordidisoli TaxID=2502893 RepID=A0A4Q2UJC2_9BACT|nr:hypothetical protein [Spirosoma sordidisoli]RYC69324.1 hypothetical protein EQG79_11975 [Spirosoma sordidisoli]
MEIRPQYLQQYLHNIAVDQLSADYLAKGYEVAKEEKVGPFRADLVAKKGDEVIIVEVKAGKMTPQKRQQVAAIGDYVKEHKNYKFLVVVANPPKAKKIDIPNLDQLLVNYLRSNYQEDLGRQFHADVQITSVNNIVLDKVTVSERGNIHVEGNGILDIELRHGTFFELPTKDSVAIGDVFPFSFTAILTYSEDKQLTVSSMLKLDFDTSERLG